MNQKPVFITFEGGEGAGKSTQIKKVSEYLSTLNIPHILTREPGGTPLAEKIRNILVVGKADAMDPMTEYLLFSASRRDHIEKIIKPALAKGTWVLCDRFYDSSYVYQGLSPKKKNALDLTFMDKVYKEISGKDFWPDLTFIFDLDSKIGLSRADKRGEAEDRFESKGFEFHNRIREGFLKIQKNNSKRCCLVNAEQNPDQVFHHIKTILEGFI